MPHRTSRCCFLLLFLLAACPLLAQTYNLGNSQQRVQFLTGKWRFHPGDNLRWASPSFDDSSWPLLNSNQPWTTQGYPKLTGYAWYRFTVTIPAGFPKASILMPPIYNGYQLYENGRQIGSCGPDQPTSKITTTLPKVFPLMTSGNHTGQTIYMAVRVWESPRWAHYAGGGPVAGGWGLIGSDRLVTDFRFYNHLFLVNDGAADYVSTFLAGTIGFIFLVISFYRPGEREYLLFAAGELAACAAHILRLMHLSAGMISIPTYEFVAAVIAAIAWTISLYFFSIFFHSSRGLWFYLSLILAIVSPVPIAFSWPGLVSIPVSASLYCLLVIPPTIWVLALVARQSYRRNNDALILLAPTILAGGFYIVKNLGAALAQFQPYGQFKWAFGIFVPVYPFHLMLSTVFSMVVGIAMLFVLIRRVASVHSRNPIHYPPSNVVKVALSHPNTLLSARQRKNS